MKVLREAYSENEIRDYLEDLIFKCDEARHAIYAIQEAVKGIQYLEVDADSMLTDFSEFEQNLGEFEQDLEDHFAPPEEEEEDEE